MSALLLSLNNVCIDFSDQRLVNNLSLDIYQGKTTALVGESGSGKSITAMSILKLLPDNMRVTGACHYFDAPNSQDDDSAQSTDIWQLNEVSFRNVRRQSIAFIFQEPMTALNPLHTLERQIAECIHNPDFASNKQARVKELLTLVNLPSSYDKLKSYPHQLSGGQRQRVMIAMALAKEPDLLIADEPTTALDVTIQKEILELLQKLQRDLNLGILLITHDLHLVRKYSHTVSVMQFGRQIETASTEELFTQPKASYTQSLIQTTNLTIANKPSTDFIIKVSDLNSFYPAPRLGFRKQPDFHVLKQLKFSLLKGEILGVIGESGSGKTTLANVLLKLQPATGSYQLLNHNVMSMKPKAFSLLRPLIQVVFQDPFASLSPRMTVLEIITEGLIAKRYKLNAKTTKRKAIQTLEQVGLDDSFLHRYPHEFSGGQRQRIAIARAIIVEPQCIILDEPTSALDHNVQQQVLELILDLQRKLSISFILITHDLNLVKDMAHNVIILKSGEIVESGDTLDIYQNPQHPYTKKLLAAYPLSEEISPS